jgi:hypothetical protein
MISDCGLQTSDLRLLFIEAVRAAEHVPAALREHAGDVARVETSQFDETYLQFLDKQIELSPRGPAWTERLKRRRAGLAALCDVPLLYGCVFIAEVNTEYCVKVDPEARAVVYWEEYLDARSSPNGGTNQLKSEI